MFVFILYLGHSSTAFTAMTIVLLYLAGKMASFSVDSLPYRFRFTKIVFNLIPWMLAGWIAISRTQENYHHWQDVTVGSLLGIIVATLCYRIYYPSIFGRDTQTMKIPKHGFIYGAIPEEQSLLNDVDII